MMVILDFPALCGCSNNIILTHLGKVALLPCITLVNRLNI